MSPPTPADSRNQKGSSPMTQGCESNVGNFQELDGFASEGPRRRYSIDNCRSRMPNPRERGEPRSEKVILASVRSAKQKSRYKRIELHDVT